MFPWYIHEPACVTVTHLDFFFIFLAKSYKLTVIVVTVVLLLGNIRNASFLSFFICLFFCNKARTITKIKTFKCIIQSDKKAENAKNTKMSHSHGAGDNFWPVHKFFIFFQNCVIFYNSCLILIQMV